MKVGIALGSNLNNRLQLLCDARNHLRLLHEDLGPFLCSRIYETEPIDCPPGSPFFLNAAIELACTIPPLDLLTRLQRIEQNLGRPREHGFHAPRTIDLDILYYDNLHFNLPQLTLPHPRIAERPFVLAPLVDLCPDRVLPGWSMTIGQRFQEIPSQTIPKSVAVF
jgi:2-amino-4-hydroxy-6-hydroxymethyldihydropteridine diphosphokinase